jgi:hypothetical protein
MNREQAALLIDVTLFKILEAIERNLHRDKFSKVSQPWYLNLLLAENLFNWNFT